MRLGYFASSFVLLHGACKHTVVLHGNIHLQDFTIRLVVKPLPAERSSVVLIQASRLVELYLSLLGGPMNRPVDREQGYVPCLAESPSHFGNLWAEVRRELVA